MSAVLVSCAKSEINQEGNNPEERYLNVYYGDIVFPSKGGEDYFEIESNTDWSISDNADWLTIEPIEGNGNCSITLTATASDVYDDRNTVITVKAGDKTETFTVTQKYAEALLVTKNKFDIPQEGGDFTIEIQSNISYEIQIDSDSQSWISEAPKSKALTTYTHTFSVESNPNTTKRDGSVEIIGSNGKTETVNIYQAQKDELVLSKSEETVSAKGGEVRVQLRSNVDYEVIMPENNDWVEQIQSNKADELIFNVKPNSETMTRDAKITIKDKNSDLSQIFTIVQVVGSIILEETYFEVSASGDTLDVIFTPDVDYEIIMDETNSSWVSYNLETLDDSYQHHLTVYVGPNTVNKTRTAKIDIKDKNSDIKGTVTIKQLTGDIILEKNLFYINAAGETVTVPFATDIEYNVIVPDEYSDWISLVSSTQTKALRDTSFCLKIEPNTTKNGREAKIEVKDKYSDLSQALTITQDYMRIGIDGKSYTVPARGQELTVRTTSANIEYKINIPEVVSSWISVLENNDSDSFILKVEPNSDLNVRNATISISDENDLMSEKISIQQGIAEMSLVNRDSSKLNWFNTSLVISVASNVETELIIPENAQTWIQNITEKIAPDSDIKTFRLNILANESDVDNRETEVILKDKYGPMQLKYYILQYNNSEYHGDVLLDSEDDLSEYSRYERIYGDVTITGLQTLQRLNNQLNEIYGNADISVTSLDGLYGLKNIYGNLSVYSQSPEGLNNLETIQGNLTVDAGGGYSEYYINFERLKIIGGNCDARYSKFEQLQRIEGSILNICPAYLPKLEYVGGDMTCSFTYGEENKEYNLKSLIFVGGNMSVAAALERVPESLEFLQNLEIIKGNCSIYTKSTEGLNKLKTIGGNFNITADSFEGLTSLEYIGGNFIPANRRSDVEFSFVGLSNLKSIGGTLNISITTSHHFSSFDGLNNLQQVGGFMFSVSSESVIVHNNMESFEGLDNLKRVLGDFIITGCSFGLEKLTSLNGLNLQEIAGNVTIGYFPNLSDVSSLGKLTSVNDITITNCKSLFDFTPLVETAKNMTGTWYVYGCGYNPTKYQMLNGESKPQE